MNIGPEFKKVAPIPFAGMVRGVKDQAATGQPARAAFLSRIHKRRFASLRAAAEVLDVLPDEGESLHAIMSGFYDLMHLLIVLLNRLGSPCEMMRVATLSLSKRNVQEMCALLDSVKVKRIDLLTSDFFRKHDDDIFAELVQEFSARGQRVAAARSHCKVVTMLLDDGRKYVLDGSPNLRTNRNAEQLTLTRSPEFHAWADAWLSDMVTNHEIRQSESTGKS